MSLRSLLRASALYTVGNIAPKIGAFLLLPVYVRFLTQADYGALALLTSLAGILAIVFHLGLDGSLMRLHFDSEGRGQARLYSTVTLFTLGLSVVVTLLLALVLGPFFEDLFAGVPFIPLGGLALLIAIVGAVQFVPSTLFRATGQAGRFLAVYLGSFLVSSIVSVVLVVVFGLGAAGVLTGQVVGGTVTLIVAIVAVGRLGDWTFDRASLREAIGLGLPLLPHGIASWALRLADRWLLALLLGLPAIDARAQIGIYAVGYQLGYVVSLVITSFNAAWSPYFFRIGNRADGPRFYTEMTTLVIAGLLVLATAVSALAPEIVAVIARPGYEPAAEVMPVIAFASVCQGLYVMFVTVVFLTKRTGRLALITLAAAALNVGLNVVLIQPLGIMGAAWASLAAYAFFAVATYLYARGNYPVRVDWPRLAVLGVGAIATVLLARAVSTDPSLLGGAIHLAVTAAFAIVVAAVCAAPFARLRVLSRGMPLDRATR